MRNLSRLIALVAAVALTGCMGTFAPHPPRTAMPFPDSSTPPQYNSYNSGFPNVAPDPVWIGGVKYWWMTKNEFARYLRHYHDWGGIRARKDKYGNALFIIPDGQLSDWHNDLGHGK